jgi:hypothetical protein
MSITSRETCIQAAATEDVMSRGSAKTSVFWPVETYHEAAFR